jgi:glycosyltransferase involved in cell wall biosynthesis
MTHRIYVTGARELADLAQAFNVMMDRVQEKARESAEFQSALAWAISAMAEWRRDTAKTVASRAAVFQAGLGAAPGWHVQAIGAYFAYVRHPFTGRAATAVARDLAVARVGLGHQVDVITMRCGDLPRDSVIDGVRVFRTPAIRRSPSRCTVPESITYLIGAARFALRRTADVRYDIVHCHFPVPSGPLAYLLRRRRGLPYIVTCHGHDVPGSDLGRLKRVHYFTAPVIRPVLRHAAAVTCPSNWLRQVVLANVGRYDIHVIPYAIDSAKFQPRPKRKFVLMAGRLVRDKNFHCVLRALEGVESDFEVHVAGDGPMRPALEELARKVPMKVTFHGWLDRKDPKLRGLFEEAMIVCQASEIENASVVLLEAMLCGAAVVAGNDGGSPELVADCGALVTPGDVPALRAVLTKWLANPAEAESLGKRARERALTDYDSKKITNEYLALLEAHARRA